MLYWRKLSILLIHQKDFSFESKKHTHRKKLYMLNYFINFLKRGRTFITLSFNYKNKIYFYEILRFLIFVPLIFNALKLNYYRAPNNPIKVLKNLNILTFMFQQCHMYQELRTPASTNVAYKASYKKRNTFSRNHKTFTSIKVPF